MADNTVRRSIAFDALKHHDILIFLDAQDNQSEVVREALRAFIKQQASEPSRVEVMDKLNELLQKVDELVRLLRSGAVVNTSSPVAVESGEDQVQSDGLDRMMEKFME